MCAKSRCVCVSVNKLRRPGINLACVMRSREIRNVQEACRWDQPRAANLITYQVPPKVHSVGVGILEA